MRGMEIWLTMIINRVIGLGSLESVGSMVCPVLYCGIGVYILDSWGQNENPQ